MASALDTTVLQIQKQHTRSCVKNTQDSYIFYLFWYQFAEAIVNNASFPTPPIFVYLTLLPLVCVERGGGKKVRELEDAMWDALTECSAAIAK